MAFLGILSGTMPLFNLGLFDHLDRQTFVCTYGKVTYLSGSDLVLIARHGWNEQDFIPPHRVNHLAHFETLTKLGVDEIIGVYSTGSLNKNLKPGVLIVPDDFICLYPTPTSVTDKPYHITPVIDTKVRHNLVKAARELDIDVTDGGIYWQTAGPRLETRAEIRMMASAADIVGMTMASEATLAREYGIAFGAICSADNFAHGIGDKELKEGDIRTQSRKNAEKIGRIISRYIEQYRFRTRPVDRA